MFAQTRSRTNLATMLSVTSGRSGVSSLSALDVIKIIFVNDKKDFTNNRNCFAPERAHQIFGDSEEIRGFRFVEIFFYYNAATMQLLIRLWSSSGRRIRYKYMFKKLERWMPDDYITDVELFCRKLRSTKIQLPLGTRISMIDREKQLVIYRNQGTDPHYATLHRRMESLLVFFIDGVNKLNLFDPLWDFYVLYKISSVNKKKTYNPMGYCTVRKIYAPQDKIRYRISQFIIFPPYQRRGYGLVFVNKLQGYLRSRRETLEITVEDPAPRFQTLRDIVDVRDCMQQKSFKMAIRDECLTHRAIAILRRRLKLGITQIKRIFELVCLSRSDKNILLTEDYIRNAIVERLNIPVPVSTNIRGLFFSTSSRPARYAQLTILEQTDFDDQRWSREVEGTVDLIINNYRDVIRRLEKK